MIEHFGTASVHDVVVAMHFGDITRHDRLALTRLLFRVAAEGDPVAVELVDRQAREVALMAGVLAPRLDLFDVETDVVLGGGVLTARDPLLTHLIERWMSGQVPKATVRVNDVPAIAGAALLGFDYLGAGPQVEERLRACLRVG